MWNRAVRKIFKLPYQTRRWLLGPLIDQLDIRYQFYARDIKLLFQVKRCNNITVMQCLYNAYHNSSSLIGCKMSFFRYKFGFIVNQSNIQYCLARARPIVLTSEQ